MVAPASDLFNKVVLNHPAAQHDITIIFTVS